MVPLSDSLKLLNIPSIVATTIVLFSVFAPGCLIIFFFNRDLFTNLDIIKLLLLLLSLSLTLPCLLVPYLVSIASELGSFPVPDGIRQMDHFSLLIRHGANSGINLYFALAICFFGKFTFDYFLTLYIFGIVIMVLFELWYSSKKKAKDNDNLRIPD